MTRIMIRRIFLSVIMAMAASVAFSVRASELDQMKCDLIGQTMGGREKCWKFRSPEHIKELIIRKKTRPAADTRQKLASNTLEPPPAGRSSRWGFSRSARSHSGLQRPGLPPGGPCAGIVNQTQSRRFLGREAWGPGATNQSDAPSVRQSVFALLDSQSSKFNRLLVCCAGHSIVCC